MKYTLFHEQGDHIVDAGSFLEITATTIQAALDEIAAKFNRDFANDCIVIKVEAEVAA
jgi:hypothetical protein